MNIVITAIVGVVSSGLSALITWLLSRKKYITEVDHNTINNMDDSLEFYEKLNASTTRILNEVLGKYEELTIVNTTLVAEVQSLKTQIDTLVTILQAELSNVELSKYGIVVNPDGTIARTC